MTAKEYLEQGIGLNHRINSKIARISKLKDLAVNISVIYTDMPKKQNCGGSKLEDTVIKMVSLEEEINHDIVRLLDIQNEISKCIDLVLCQDLAQIKMRYFSCQLTSLTF